MKIKSQVYILNSIYLNKKFHIDKKDYEIDSLNKFEQSLFLRANEKKLLKKQKLSDEINVLNKKILMRNLLIKNDVRLLAKVLNEYKIKYIFFKGVATLSSQNVATSRYLSDIDILIDKKSQKKFFMILKNEFKINSKFVPHYPYHKSKINHSIETVKLNSGIYLDIHIRITSPFDYSVCPLSDLALEDFYQDKNLNNAKVCSSEINYIVNIYNGFLKKEIHDRSHFLIDLVNNHSDPLDIDKIYIYAGKLNLNIQTNNSFEIIRSIKNNMISEDLKKVIKLSESNKKIFFNKILWLIKNYILSSRDLTIEKYGKYYFESKVSYRFKFFFDKLKKLIKYS